ncbi:unnamed protein product [Lymnaea stagnalis]|uniref:Uncharacterized protein n=1 Tax=Lymnaea stagnalis TaxID=6523 RepID=A0AAV2H5M2_LYMST
MSSWKSKMPSSARRHIKLEQFSQFVSATRLRHVQNILFNRKAGSADIDGILCISGKCIDSRYNEGMYELLNYLLFGFFEVRKEELESSGFAEEVIDDMMIMICPDRVEVYCNPVNYYYLLPYVSHWPCLEFHCLSEDEYNGEDDDTSEEFKIRSLIAMVRGCKVIGVPYRGRGHEESFNVMAIEKWPIIQAFAIDDFEGGGFFTLMHEVVDISGQVHQLQDLQDPVSIEQLLVEPFSLMNRQWHNMMKCVQLSLETPSISVSHKKVAEPLKSYFTHGLVGHKGRVGKVPFVLFSHDSRREILQRALKGETVEASDLPIKRDQPSHMICLVASPHNPLVCARTYFFSKSPYAITKGGSGDGLQHSHDNTHLRYSIGLYLSIIRAVQEAIETYTQTSSVTQAKAKCMKTLKERCKLLDNKSLRDFINESSSAEFVLSAMNLDNSDEPLADGETSKKMKFISLTLYDIPSPDDTRGSSSSMGSMSFAETFLDSRISVAGSSEVSCDHIIMTSSIPRFQLWSMTGHTKKLLATPPSLSPDQWGEVLMTQGDICMMGTWTALLPPETVVLTVWEHGLSVQNTDYGSFTLHGSDISSVSLYDGDSMTQVALLILEVKLTDVMADHLPPHLYADVDNRGVSRILFAFSPHTKAHTQLYGNVLPAWKSDSQVPDVNRLNSLDYPIKEIHCYLQSGVNASSTATISPLKKVAACMPNLYEFLHHLTGSCGIQGPVTKDVFHSLVGTSSTQQNRGGDEKIIVTIITGAPGCDKENVAEVLTSYNKNVINWLEYKQTEECQVDTASLHQTMTNAVQTFDHWLLSKSTRLILVAPGFCDTTEVIRALSSHPDHKLRSVFVVGAVTLCIDPMNAYMENRMTFPMLTAHCAQGWVNNIVFTSQTTGPSELLNSLQTLVRSINSDVALLKAEKGIVKRSTDLDLIMSETAFQEPAMERSRVLLKPSWREGYPNAWPCHPEVRDVVLRFTHPLEKHLTLIKLRGLKKTFKRHPFEGNIYSVHGIIEFNGSPGVVELRYTPLNDKLILNDGVSAPSIGNGSTYYMSFAGISLKEQELKLLLNGCIKQKPERKRFLTREDLTPQQIDKIHASHHLDELPEGWYYNGSQFVSMDGERSFTHPNLDLFIQDYLKKKNKEIERYNQRTESESYINLWR